MARVRKEPLGQRENGEKKREEERDKDRQKERKKETKRRMPPGQQ